MSVTWKGLFPQFFSRAVPFFMLFIRFLKSDDAWQIIVLSHSDKNRLVSTNQFKKKILWGGYRSLFNINKIKQFENWLFSFHYYQSNYMKKGNLKYKKNKSREFNSQLQVCLVTSEISSLITSKCAKCIIKHPISNTYWDSEQNAYNELTSIFFSW